MEYKKYDQFYLKQIIDLLNICFPRKKISEKSFIWKHYNKIFNDKTLGMMAIDNEKVCSFVCFVPIAITRGGNILENIYSCAVQATHTEYRRQGIVSDLTQLIEKDLASGTVYLGFSNEDGVKIDKFSKKINYKILGQLNTKYVLSLPYKTNLEIKKVEKIIQKNNYYSDYYNILKDNDYVNWRYVENPKNEYEYYKVTKNPEEIGYIICRDKKTGYEVLDLLLINNDKKLYAETIKSFSKFSLSQKKIYSSYSYLPNKFWGKCFPVVSIRKKTNIYFTIKTTDANLLNIDNWIIQGGDIQ